METRFPNRKRMFGMWNCRWRASSKLTRREPSMDSDEKKLKYTFEDISREIWGDRRYPHKTDVELRERIRTYIRAKHGWLRVKPAPAGLDRRRRD